MRRNSLGTLLMKRVYFTFLIYYVLQQVLGLVLESLLS